MSETLSPEAAAAIARALAEARTSGVRLSAPPEPRDLSEADAWAVHMQAVAALGPVAGWKVGAPSPTAEPGAGALTADTIHEGPASFAADAFGLWAVEAEIAVRFGTGLPARQEPYDVEEVFAAVAGWSAAIEVLDSAFADWKPTPKAWKIADRQSHGALVLGEERRAPPAGPLDRVPVRLLVDGEAAFEHEGGNTAGDPTRLLVWLANWLRDGPLFLKAGDVVTTGSTTPFLVARAGQRIVADFPGFGSAELTVGA